MAPGPVDATATGASKRDVAGVAAPNSRPHMTRRSTSRFRPDRSSEARRPVPTTGGLPRWLRIGVFATVVLVVGIVAANLVIGRLQPPGMPEAGALQVHASMEGFDPNQLTVKAGQPVKIQLASMRSMPWALTGRLDRRAARCSVSPLLARRALISSIATFAAVGKPTRRCRAS